MKKIFHLMLLLAVVFVGPACAMVSQRYWTPPPDFLGSAVTQAVVVRPSGDGFRAALTLWSKKTAHGEWERSLGPFPAVIGRNGFASVNEKNEGDGKTPSGIFFLGPAFGRPVDLPTGIEYRQAGPADRWVDDPASSNYNQWVSGDVPAASFEKMSRDDGLYDAGIVVRYNTAPVIPGRGSAIFVHIWRGNGQHPTAGCVALERNHLLELLKALDAAQFPVIVLGS